MIIKGIQLKGVTVRDRASVVQSDLAYYIDAGNSASYSGTGSSMTNISSVSLPVSTLVGSPTYYSRGEASYFSFNGSNQYVIGGNMWSAFQYPNFTSNPNVTIETWVRTSAGANGVLATEQGTPPSGTTINQGFHAAQQNIVSDYIYQGVYNFSGQCAGPSNGPVTRNVWQQYTMTYNFSTGTVNNYINGTIITTLSGISRISSQTYGSSNFYYGIMAADSTNFGDGSALAGDWSIFRAYTRPLSDAEVLQNYLATYPRYYA